MVSKKFGFWLIFGAMISAAVAGHWDAPFLFMLLMMYDAIKPDDKQN